MNDDAIERQYRAYRRARVSACVRVCVIDDILRTATHRASRSTSRTNRWCSVRAHHNRASSYSISKWLGMPSSACVYVQARIMWSPVGLCSQTWTWRRPYGSSLGTGSTQTDTTTTTTRSRRWQPLVLHGTAPILRAWLEQLSRRLACTRATASKWIDPPALVPSTSSSQPIPIINLANPNPPGLHHSRTNIHRAYRRLPSLADETRSLLAEAPAILAGPTESGLLPSPTCWLLYFGLSSSLLSAIPWKALPGSLAVARSTTWISGGR